jgi:hypothetical protein
MDGAGRAAARGEPLGVERGAAGEHRPYDLEVWMGGAAGGGEGVPRGAPSHPGAAPIRRVTKCRRCLTFRDMPARMPLRASRSAVSKLTTTPILSLSLDPPMTRGCLGAVGRVRDDRPRILVVNHSGRGRSALANGHGGEAPRGSVDSGLAPPRAAEGAAMRSKRQRRADPTRRLDPVVAETLLGVRSSRPPMADA